MKCTVFELCWQHTRGLYSLCLTGHISKGMIMRGDDLKWLALFFNIDIYFLGNIALISQLGKEKLCNS